MEKLPSNKLEMPLPDQATRSEMLSASNAKKLAELYVIDSDAKFQQVAEEAKECKRRAKALDEKRKELTRPLDNLKKQWMDIFNEPIKGLTEAEIIFKRKMQRYLEEQRATKQAAEEKAKEAAKDYPDHVPAVHMEEPKAKGVYERDVYKGRMTDIEAVLKGMLDGVIPKSLFVMNQGELNRMAGAMKEDLNFPGIEVYIDTSIGIRT